MLYPLDRPPVFVCGVQRSGTTLLVKMLSRNEQVEFLPQESHLFPLLWKPGGKLNRGLTPETLADFLLKASPEVNYGWTRATDFLTELTNSIRALPEPPETVSGLLRYYLYFWQTQLGKRVVTGEKTPAHIYYAPEILSEFPQCKMILMYRDPRAAALSEWVKLEGNDRNDRTFHAFNFIVRWSTAMTLINRLKRNKNVLLVSYEDLITTPGGTLKEVCSFAGINFMDAMLEVGVTNSSFSDKKQAGINFNTDNLIRWKTDLPETAIALIEYHLKQQMTAMGYEMSGMPVSGGNLKQTLKLRVANLAVLAHAPAFHHFNRNQKYRNL